MTRSAALACAALVAATPLAAQYQTAAAHAGHAGGRAERLGEVSFPTSASAAARPYFVRGVLYLHNFHYAEAVDAFREARRLDPGDAMSAWGEAMAHNWTVWNTQDSVAARAALARLAPTREQRLAAARTPRERGYLEAVEALYGAGSKPQRDTAYSRAMGRLHAAYPDDPEAAAFYALALLGLNQGDREPVAYARAAEIADSLFRRYPRHPGAAHYLIHAVDDPAHAARGLPAARAYSGIAPDAGHAQHMVSHIFIARGMWDEVVAANLRAQHTTGNATAPAKYGHGAFWLVYAYAQQGKLRDARAWVDSFRVQLRSVAGNAPAERYTRNHLALALAAYTADGGAWPAADALAALEAGEMGGGASAYDFARGWSALRRGDAAAAGGFADRIAARAADPGTRTSTPADRGYWRVMETVLRAEIAKASGTPDSAVALLRAAAGQEDALPLAFGPPVTVKPAREALGELLLELRRPAEAAPELEAALRRTPGRPAVLLPLARAYAALGRRAEARARYAELAAAWHAADPGLPGLAEARAGGAAGPAR